MERLNHLFKKRKENKNKIAGRKIMSIVEPNNSNNNFKINHDILEEMRVSSGGLSEEISIDNKKNSGEYNLLNNNEISGINNNSEDKKNSGEKTPLLVLVYLYFIVIASVLGTGILALPVKLSQSGFTPFLASYTLCYLMQLVSVFYLIEVLQRIYSIIKSNSIISNAGDINLTTYLTTLDDETGKENQNRSEDILLYSDSSIIEDGDHLKDSHGSSIKSSPPTEPYSFEMGDKEEYEGDEKKVEEEEVEPEETPNLHYIGLKFLGRISYPIFIFSVILHFCSTLISYGLAGSEAYAQILGISHGYIILPVVTMLSLIVIFGSRALQHIITFFTFGKGTLLVIIVFITGIISNQVENSISNDWQFIGKSFLISTVALGGSSSVLPLVFPKIIFNRREMMKCYIVVASSLSTVYLLNITWCWFLLRIIPQMPDSENPSIPSLFEAAKQGEIATIPLMHVVQQGYPKFLYIARVIDIFIVISITISFITVGNGFKHILDGFIYSWRSKSINYHYHVDSVDNQQLNMTTPDYQQSRFIRFYNQVKQMFQMSTQRLNQYINHHEQQSTLEQSPMKVRIPIREIIFYSGFFGFILLICLLNPKGFLLVMEGGTSLGLNLQAGAFIVMMLNFSRKNYENYKIPLPVSDILYHLRYLVVTYFTFAVLYDIYLIIV